MIDVKKKKDISEDILKALDKAIEKVIAETKATNTYLVISDEKGNIKKIPAKDL